MRKCNWKKAALAAAVSAAMTLSAVSAAPAAEEESESAEFDLNGLLGLLGSDAEGESEPEWLPDEDNVIRSKAASLFNAVLEYEPEDVTYPLTIDNGDGEELVLEAEPQKVVSVSPSLTEILCDLGAGDKLIGRSDYCNYPEEVMDIESVGVIYGADIEKILSLEPDLVLASAHFSDESLAQLKDAGVKVLYLYDESTVDGVPNIILTMGTVFNREQEAFDLAMNMASRISGAASLVADVEPVPVYYVVGYGEYGDYTATGDTYINDMLVLAGAENIAADAEGWSYSVETLLEKDPEYIIVPAYAYDDFIAAEPYTELTAVKEGRVYAINNDMLDRQIPRNADAIVEIANLLHPEEFESLKEADEELYNHILGITSEPETAEEIETEAEPAA